MPSYMTPKTKKEANAKLTPERKVDLMLDELRSSFAINKNNEVMMKQGEPKQEWVYASGNDVVSETEEAQWLDMPYPNPDYIAINIDGKQQILDEYIAKKDDGQWADSMNSGGYVGSLTLIEALGFIDKDGKKTYYTEEQVRQALLDQEQAKTLPSTVDMYDMLKMKKI